MPLKKVVASTRFTLPGGDNRMRVARTLATDYRTCDRLANKRILHR